MGLGERSRTRGGRVRPGRGKPGGGAAAVDASRDALAPWLPWCTERYSPASAEAFLAERTIEHRT